MRAFHSWGDVEDDDAPPPGHVLGGAPPPPAPAAPAAAAGGRFVTAAYDYDGEEADDLSFREGDQIEVTEEVDENWWRGRVDGGAEGMFPSAYAQ